jgi:plastocyanin
MTREDRTGRGDGGGVRESSRRRLLAVAGLSLSTLATAGCLSNPWGPSEPGADATTGDGDTTRDETTTGGEPTTEDADTATATAVPAEERDPDLVVAVAPDGFRFDPSSFTVAAGDVVRWEWRDSGHNVQVRTKPDDSDWTGTGPASKTFDEGHVRAHVFETAGDYEFYCAPHQSLGMTGSFTVR